MVVKEYEENGTKVKIYDDYIISTNSEDIKNNIIQILMKNFVALSK